MPTVAELNTRIGADIRPLNKAIREAEKSLRGAVSSFSSIGNSLSLALSAPIAAFTGMSIKAAGDMESLRLALEGTMKDAGYSIGQAREELEALRVAALAPGLDFEQAVRGSIRLQSVGKSAEEAREIIVQLANALALSGGTADQLDGVTKQFTQMIGKGKLMQEDLSIILENMPALAKVMQDTFGATNAEMLRDMGVSVEDFISGLTKGMKELPRAQGGIANAIVNAQNAIKQAIASVGEEINKTFNVTGALNDFSTWVANLAKWFRELDEDTKRLIGGIVVFAAALGPAFKVMQGGVWIAGQLHLAFLGLQKMLAQSLAGQAIPSLIAKWRALDFAMKASIIGGIAAVVLAAAAAFAVMSKDMSAAAQAARQVEKTKQDAAASIAMERAEIETLVAVAKNETKSKDERMAAMNRLIAISPEYQKALQNETINTQELDRVTGALVNSMLRAATARKAVEDIAEIDRKLADLKNTSNPSFWQTAGNAILSFGNANSFAGRQVGTAIENYNEQRATLEKTRAELMKLAQENVHVFGTNEKVKASVSATTKEGKLYAEVLSDIANVSAQQDLLGSEKIVEQAKAVENGIKRLLDGGFTPMSKEVQGLKSQLKGLFGGVKMEIAPKIATKGIPDALSSIKDPFKGIADSARIATSAMQQNLTVAGQAAEMYRMVREGVDGLSTSMQAMAAAMISNGQVMQAIMLTVGDAIAQAGAQGAATFAEFTKAALGSAAKVIRAWIQMAVTRAALSALQNVPFPFNIAAAAAAGGLASGLFNALIKKVGIPALAEGGVLTGPQLVMAGEYPGARVNPEIVTPENKMRDVFAEVMRTSGGGGAMTLTTRISGDDLLFVLEKAKAKAARRR